MGRRRTPEELAALKEQATHLRQAGVGVRRIAAGLGVSQSTVHALLHDVPVASSGLRVRAKDEHRGAAVALRLEGRTYKEIQAELGVSKGSLSLWLRDLPFPDDQQRAALRSREAEDAVPEDDRGVARALRGDGWLLKEIAEELAVSVALAQRWCAGLPIPPRASHGRDREAMAELVERRWASYRVTRDAAREQVHAEQRDRLGRLTDRELDLVVAALYWAEGSKSKPWRLSERLILINSDPGVIALFLHWLRARGVDEDRISLRLNIHESADLSAATDAWVLITGRSAESFARPTLKRHNPVTVRKNTGESYIGCLTVHVRRSRLLYQEIEGRWRAVVSSATEHAADLPSRSPIA